MINKTFLINFLYQDVLDLRKQYADYDSRIAVIIVEAVRLDIIPHKYLQDAETLAKVSDLSVKTIPINFR